MDYHFPKNSRSFAGKVAIVSGAGAHGDGIGIGGASAILYSDDGCKGDPDPNPEHLQRPQKKLAHNMAVSQETFGWPRLNAPPTSQPPLIHGVAVLETSTQSGAQIWRTIPHQEGRAVEFKTSFSSPGADWTGLD
ncbi:hypothetical protein LTR93_011719 [Exophiala xenobiotica]|nr:hypothetical protein LTR93_011719 [Exophiala xenobiotica]